MCEKMRAVEADFLTLNCAVTGQQNSLFDTAFLKLRQNLEMVCKPFFALKLLRSKRENDRILVDVVFDGA